MKRTMTLLGLLALVLTGCASPAPIETPAFEIPKGFDFENLYTSGIWVSTPEHGGSECGEGALFDCWNVVIQANERCEGYFEISMRELNASGGALSSYIEYAKARVAADQRQSFSWDSQWWAEEVIDTIEVENVKCVDVNL
ncbi:hypothetical protein E0W80_09535 [Microbacterium sp. PI-1]|uniref:hypothetical protein n=1 Tax=Microbacterium sp. J1-1 TaxID=2992441 RepID=UPI00103F27EF|nr:hypothetical protein [Microbacterium sp. J1-1]TCJ23790.1 hypothetical protein E0W80_09535 [Microbacterium sp. PI-1]UUE20069.1 hypothetical protein LRQ07_14920 [Microbacterium sp. J1-1]